MNKRLNDAIGVPNFTDVMFARHVLGQKQYELTDHLGDVLATISDKRSTDSLTGDTVTTGAVDTVASWKPVVVTATDYYPFGMQMPGRYLSDTSTHCYTTTITEPVDYFNFTYYLFSAYPLPVTPFGGAYLYSLIGGDQQLHTFGHSGDSLVISIDSITPGAVQCLKLVTDGGTNTYGAHIISGGVNVGSSTISYSYGGITTIYFLPTTPTVTLVIGELFSSLLPHAHFDLNLRGLYLPRFDSAVLEDVVTSVCNEDRYHYGFNGKMKDNEWAGVGNHIDFKFRGYDPRIARFILSDPLTKHYPYYSSYQFAGNSPIKNIDLEGLEPCSADIHIRQMETGYLKGTVTKDQLLQFYGDNAMAAFYGGSFLVGGELAISGNLIKSMLLTGGVSATFNAGWTAFNGGDIKSTVNSAISGFVGGAALSIPGGKLGIGFLSGVAEEATNQFLKNIEGDANGYDIKNMVLSGSISSLSNVISNKLCNSILGSVDKSISKQIGIYNSKQYKGEIKSYLRTCGFHGGDRALNIAANRIINRQISHFLESANGLKAAVKQGLERSMDAVSNDAKDKTK